MSSRTNLRSNLCLVVSVGVCCELAKCTDKMVLVTTPFGSEEDLDPWGRWAKIQPRYTNEIVPRTGIEGNVGGHVFAMMQPSLAGHHEVTKMYVY